MSNHKSVELGWIIKGVDDWRVFCSEKYEQDEWDVETTILQTDDMDIGIYGELCVETPPFDINYMFVSYDHCLNHKLVWFDEPDIGVNVRRILQNRAPEARITWGVIHTER